ncbi:MAG: hypothetical protein OEV14_05420 [Gammaproteobacteria bacterium]|nr:hypothetical protein [Gammaproteobacteria bacterium]
MNLRQNEQPGTAFLARNRFGQIPVLVDGEVILTDSRAIKRLKWPLNYEQVVRTGYRILKIMDEHLAEREWLTLKHVTIAYLACYPYVGLAAEGGVDTSSFTHVGRWVESVEAVPGFWPMPRIPGLARVPLVPVPVAQEWLQPRAVSVVDDPSVAARSRLFRSDAGTRRAPRPTPPPAAGRRSRPAETAG